MQLSEERTNVNDERFRHSFVIQCQSSSDHSCFVIFYLRPPSPVPHAPCYTPTS